MEKYILDLVLNTLLTKSPKSVSLVSLRFKRILCANFRAYILILSQKSLQKSKVAFYINLMQNGVFEKWVAFVGI